MDLTGIIDIREKGLVVIIIIQQNMRSFKTGITKCSEYLKDEKKQPL